MMKMRRSSGPVEYSTPTPFKVCWTVSSLNGNNFCLKGGIRHCELKLSQFTREVVTVNGKTLVRYTYTECGSKNRSGGLKQLHQANKIVHQYESEDIPRCHVLLLDKYIAKSPAEAKAKDIFYMKPKTVQPKYPCAPWFTTVPIGKNKLSEMVNTMAQEGKLDKPVTNPQPSRLWSDKDVCCQRSRDVNNGKKWASFHHRLSKLRNRDWNPPTHPCDHVCCILPVFWRRNFRLHVFRGSAVHIVTLSKTSALYRIRSSMAVSLPTAEDFSPLDSFTSILCKLATKEFASETLPRHRVIQQQIEALLQSMLSLNPCAQSYIRRSTTWYRVYLRRKADSTRFRWHYGLSSFAS